MTDETTKIPTKKDVLAAFNAVEVTTTPPTKAEVERARRTLVAEEGIVALRDLLVEVGIADGDLTKAMRTTSSFSALSKNALATIASIPDNVLDPEAAPAAPKAPRKPRETKTATLSDADKAAAAERAAEAARAIDEAALEIEEAAIQERTDAKNGDIQTEAVVLAAPGAITPEAPTAEEINIAATQSPVVGQRPPLTRPAPILAEAPNSAADPRGAEDPNLGDGF